MNRVKIVIAGGGFAGLSAAMYLRRTLDVEFDHLLLALGSETNFFDLPGVGAWAVTMKTLADAALLRNRIVALLEAATIETDESVRRRLLTFVAAGGGFAGVETIGALNDFVREAARHYPKLNEALIRVIVVHPEPFLLPDLGAELGAYAQRKLSERMVEVITGARVERYDGSVVELSNGTAIPAETLLWTARVRSSPVIDALPCRKAKGNTRCARDGRRPGTSNRPCWGGVKFSGFAAWWLGERYT